MENKQRRTANPLPKRYFGESNSYNTYVKQKRSVPKIKLLPGGWVIKTA